MNLNKMKKLITVLLLTTLVLMTSFDVNASKIPSSPWWRQGKKVINNFPVARVERVLSIGFSTISNRYITPISARTMGLKAIEVISDKDDRILIKETNGRFSLYYDNKLLRLFVSPKDNDPLNWGRLSIAMILELKKKF